MSGDDDAELVAEAPTVNTNPTPPTETPSANPVAVPTDSPTADTPGTDAPGTDAPTDDTPAADTPTADAPDIEPAVDETPVEDEGDDESGEGPGANASRSERISWNLQSGNFHRNRGHPAMAARRYQAVLRIMPRNGRALAGLARVAIMQNDSAGAVRYARRLVRVNSNNAGNRVLLGDTLRADGKTAEARAEWERALTINRRHRGARRRLGQ